MREARRKQQARKETAGVADPTGGPIPSNPEPEPKSLWDEKLPNGRTARQGARPLGLVFLGIGVGSAVYVWAKAVHRHGRFTDRDVSGIPFGIVLYLAICGFIASLVWLEARKSRRRRLEQASKTSSPETPTHQTGTAMADRPPSKTEHPD